MISREFFHFQICETFGNLGVDFSMTWLLIHRIEENKGKSTDDLVVNFPKDTTILSSLKKTLIGLIEFESQAYERKDWSS